MKNTLYNSIRPHTTNEHINNNKNTSYFRAVYNFSYLFVVRVSLISSRWSRVWWWLLDMTCTCFCVIANHNMVVVLLRGWNVCWWKLVKVNDVLILRCVVVAESPGGLGSLVSMATRFVVVFVLNDDQHQGWRHCWYLWHCGRCTFTRTWKTPRRVRGTTCSTG